MEKQSTTPPTDEVHIEPVINALKILIKAVMIGQKHGAYTLSEDGRILESIRVIQEKFCKKEHTNQHLSKIDDE